MLCWLLHHTLSGCNTSLDLGRHQPLLQSSLTLLQLLSLPCFPFASSSFFFFLSLLCLPYCPRPADSWVISDSFGFHSLALLCLFVSCFTQPFTDQATLLITERLRRNSTSGELDIVIQDVHVFLCTLWFRLFSEVGHCSRCLLQLKLHRKSPYCPRLGECLAELGLCNIPWKYKSGSRHVQPGHSPGRFTNDQHKTFQIYKASWPKMFLKPSVFYLFTPSVLL